MHRCWFADDDATMHFVFAKYCSLLEHDVDVTSFYNGEEVVKTLQQSGPDVMPDLFILDLKMPVRDGWSVVEAIGRHFRDQWFAPIVILTSSIDPSDMTQARNEPLITRYEVKPLTMDTVRSLFDLVITVPDIKHGIDKP